MQSFSSQTRRENPRHFMTFFKRFVLYDEMAQADIAKTN